MKNIKISLTSIGLKILSIILVIIMLIISSILLSGITNAPWYAIMFSILVTIILFATCIIFFRNNIILLQNQKILKICNIKQLVINIKDIKELKVDTKNSLNPNKYCFIALLLNNGDIKKFSGYSSILSKNAVKITEDKIKLLNEQIINLK